VTGIFYPMLVMGIYLISWLEDVVPICPQKLNDPLIFNVPMDHNQQRTTTDNP
jgi:hypothetical protein